MYCPSDNIQVMIGIETDKIIEDLFDSFLQRYRKDLEGSMRGSEFAFDSVDSLYYKLHKISLNRGGSYIDFHKSLKNIKATINPKNNDMCFQYAITVGLNHEKNNKYPQRMRKTKPFFDQYNWKEINFLSNKKDLENFESINKSLVLSSLYVPFNTEDIRHAHMSKFSLRRENQIILLIITEGQKWNYLAVKNCLHYLKE